MNARFLASTAACAVAVALGSCGGSNSDSDSHPASEPKAQNPAAAGQSTGASAAPVDPNDKRGIAFQCITRDKGLPASFVGKQSIQVGANGGPRIEFLTSGGEAEGLQFQGKAQSAEQIGSALLYINQGTEDQLDKLEQCLNKQ